ncbi:MAG TPA: hypothetical protein VJV21_02270 [Pyrinomonadaceae bacterium]|nr:hypothetical protein [Pyrinomonadaceae bacterium]
MAEDSRGILNVLRHPLLLLVVGSVIGSFLIPWISHKTDRSRVLREARLKKKVEITNKNTETISKLHLRVTRLGIFHKDNIRLKPSPAKLAVLQDKLGEDMNDLYADFQREGWWWYRSLNDEAVILEIVPPGGFDKLRKDVDAYEKNITDTVAAFNAFWHKCLSKEYDFQDANITQIQNQMYERLEQLRQERIGLVNNLVQDFTAE